MSPSLRGRGLKYFANGQDTQISRSPSLRGRGLKYRGIARPYGYVSVALFTRAWIEISATEIADMMIGGRPLYEGVD